MPEHAGRMTGLDGEVNNGTGNSRSAPCGPSGPRGLVLGPYGVTPDKRIGARSGEPGPRDRRETAAPAWSVAVPRRREASERREQDGQHERL